MHRIGLLVNSKTLNTAEYDLTLRAQTAKHYVIDILILDTSPPRKETAAEIMWQAVTWLERKLLSRVSNQRIYYHNHPVPADAISWSDHSTAYDWFLDLGRNLPLSEYPEAIRDKILVLRPDGCTSTQDGPLGFWEVFNRTDNTGYEICRLPSADRSPEIMISGRVATQPLYSINYVKLSRLAANALHRWFEKLEKPKKITLEGGVQHPCAATAPSCPKQLSYIFIKTIPLALSRIFGRYVLNRTRKWHVGYLCTDDWCNADLSQITVIPNPSNRFLADPFVWTSDGITACFVEDYDFDTQLGHLSAYRLDEDGATRIGTVLKEPFHLSFPYLFEHEGTLFMCPETHGNGDIRLYRCVSFPDKWVYHCTLIDNVSAADTCIFNYQSKWWLFTNLDTAGIGDHCTELHIFSSDDLLSGKWRPHSQNPVIRNSEHARNAGLFTQNGTIFRAYQKQGFLLYGASMGVAEVAQLSAEQYAETSIHDIDPDFLNDISGTHTLSVTNNLVAIDFAKRVRRK